MHHPQSRNIAETLRRAADAVDALDAAGDWIDAWASDVLTSDQAGIIAECSAATVRRRAAEFAAVNRPIGINIGGSVWLISKSRWLALIQREQGATAAVAATRCAEKLAEMSAPAQNSSSGERQRSA